MKWSIASTADKPMRKVPAKREASLKFLAIRTAATPKTSSNRNLKEVWRDSITTHKALTSLARRLNSSSWNPRYRSQKTGSNIFLCSKKRLFFIFLFNLPTCTRHRSTGKFAWPSQAQKPSSKILPKEKTTENPKTCQARITPLRSKNNKHQLAPSSCNHDAFEEASPSSCSMLQQSRKQNQETLLFWKSVSMKKSKQPITNPRPSLLIRQFDTHLNQAIWPKRNQNMYLRSQKTYQKQKYRMIGKGGWSHKYLDQ